MRDAGWNPNVIESVADCLPSAMLGHDRRLDIVVSTTALVACALFASWHDRGASITEMVAGWSDLDVDGANLWPGDLCLVDHGLVGECESCDTT